MHQKLKYKTFIEQLKVLDCDKLDILNFNGMNNKIFGSKFKGACFGDINQDYKFGLYYILQKDKYFLCLSINPWSKENIVELDSEKIGHRLKNWMFEVATSQTTASFNKLDLLDELG